MEKLPVKNNLEKEPKVKINLLFEVDEITEQKLQEFYERLRAKYGETIISRKDDGLPFHFTIIGGGEIAESDLVEFEERGGGKIGKALNKLKMYNEEKRIPKPTLDSQLSWHTYPYGKERILILRLKFLYKDYILSGDRKLNRKIAKDLGNPYMDFTLPSHTTICKFTPPENIALDFDLLLKGSQRIFEEMNIKENMELIPAVYIKREEEKKFSKLNLENYPKNTKKA